MRQTTAQRLKDIETQLERIELMFLMKDPTTAKTADAYDGLRKTVIAAVGERRAHLVHLAHVDSALQHGWSLEQLQQLVAGQLETVGVVKTIDVSRRDAFEIVGPIDARSFEKVEPAYIDRTTGLVVRQGRARAVPHSEIVTSENALGEDDVPVENTAGDRS